ncbi:MAG: type II secretion system protein [Acidobacteria bacterium]|nr:MAG: type II secretion system protein [Acidobacteriota bacterium]
MTARRPIRARPRRKQDGFLLLGIVTMLSIFGIMSGMAVQEWSVIERREREAELLFIQEQYAAAILFYQQEQGKYPVSLEDLDREGQHGRFIRKLYTDPITHSKSIEDWCLLKIGPAGRVVSSCSAGDALGGIGLGSSFKPGRETAVTPGNRNQALIGGIVGVHSRSSEQAFNTAARGESTYDKWYYTTQDYQRDVSARAIPGLPSGQKPGVGRGPQRPGQPGMPPGLNRPGRNRPGLRVPGPRKRH